MFAGMYLTHYVGWCGLNEDQTCLYERPKALCTLAADWCMHDCAGLLMVAADSAACIRNHLGCRSAKHKDFHKLSALLVHASALALASPVTPSPFSFGFPVTLCIPELSPTSKMMHSLSGSKA